MTAPSNANTSGLGGRPVGVDEALLVQSLAKIVRREMQNNTIPVRDRSESAVRGVLKALNTTAVTAASAQARIADLEARVEYLRGSRDGHAAHAHSEFEARVAAEARADRLARFGQHTNWELSHGYPDGEEEDGCWLVHSVNGGRNDREWTLIGRGETPDDAIQAALQQETQK